jgi:hypothetical protein
MNAFKHQCQDTAIYAFRQKRVKPNNVEVQVYCLVTRLLIEIVLVMDSVYANF